jgi:hypothetical protein
MKHNIKSGSAGASKGQTGNNVEFKKRNAIGIAWEDRADALNHIGKKAMLCLREPSLGPSFGGGRGLVLPVSVRLRMRGTIFCRSSRCRCDWWNEVAGMTRDELSCFPLFFRAVSNAEKPSCQLCQARSKR